VNNVLKHVLSHELAVRVRLQPQNNDEPKQIPFENTKIKKAVVG